MNEAPPPNLYGFTTEKASRQMDIERLLLDLPSAGAFRNHLEKLSSEPHPFGSDANVRVGEYISCAMSDAGLKVETFPYDVYVPEPGGAIDIALVTPVRQPLNGQEYILEEDPYSAHPDLRHGWNAYSGSGDVTGEVVYANYGTKEDFNKLLEMNIPIEGKIIIARFGGNFRGFKVKYAQENGAIGILMYSDPNDGGFPQGPVYPEGKFLNESAVQRGSLLTLGYVGDPLTPFEPAIPVNERKTPKRLDPEKLAFPDIPVAPLPYGSARQILEKMRGPGVPSGWQGGLPFTYRLTGGSDLTVRMKVDQPRKLTRATNVIGTIEGTDLPDEWIILGCHYDAWEFGTADPNSGSAMLLTLADALGTLMRDGRKPVRTIKIAHWDAEEYNIIGSTEWVEQFREELSKKAVAYINADMAACGPNFSAASSPSLKQPIFDAAREVAYPGTDRTIFDTWRKDAEKPGIGNLGGGSDHIAFYMHLGIPSAGMGMGGFTPYHTAYDDLAWYQRFVDPDFVFGPAVASVFGVLATRLANASLLPFDLASYPVDLLHHVETLEKRSNELSLPFRFNRLKAAIYELDQAALGYQKVYKRTFAQGKTNKDNLQKLNETLIDLEKGFLHKQGLQDRPWNRSLFTAEDPFSGYGSWMLPGLRHELEHGSTEHLRTWEEIYVEAVESITSKIRHLVETLTAE